MTFWIVFAFGLAFCWAKAREEERERPAQDYD